MQIKFTAVSLSVLALAAPAALAASPPGDAGAPPSIPAPMVTNAGGHSTGSSKPVNASVPPTGTASGGNGTATGNAPVTFNVSVGDKGLAFSPTQVMAKPGDKITFMFYPKNHTVTQSTFAQPCSMMPSGLDSGYMPVAASATMKSMPMWTITINDTKPLWFYCAQVGHCQAGMVFAVNPTADKSFASFQAMAMNGPSSAANSASNSSGTTSNGTSASSTSSTSSASHVSATVGALAFALLSSVALF